MRRHPPPPRLPAIAAHVPRAAAVEAEFFGAGAALVADAAAEEAGEAGGGFAVAAYVPGLAAVEAFGARVFEKVALAGLLDLIPRGRVINGWDEDYFLTSLGVHDQRRAILIVIQRHAIIRELGLLDLHGRAGSHAHLITQGYPGVKGSTEATTGYRVAGWRRVLCGADGSVPGVLLTV